jgi:hypothetical protein
LTAITPGIASAAIVKTLQNENQSPALIPSEPGSKRAREQAFDLRPIEACPRQTLCGDLDFAAAREGEARLFVTLACLSVARVSGMTEMIAARRARVTFAGFHAHMSLGTMWKALEFDRGKCRIGHEKGQTEEHEKKRE